MAIWDPQHADRYLAINRWLVRRYRDKNGTLLLSIGAVPSIYSRLDLAFFQRYILRS